MCRSDYNEYGSLPSHMGYASEGGVWNFVKSFAAIVKTYAGPNPGLKISMIAKDNSVDHPMSESRRIACDSQMVVGK